MVWRGNGANRDLVSKKCLCFSSLLQAKAATLLWSAHMHRHTAPQTDRLEQLSFIASCSFCFFSFSHPSPNACSQSVLISSFPFPRALPLSLPPLVLQCDVTIRELMLRILRVQHPSVLIHTHSTNESCSTCRMPRRSRYLQHTFFLCGRF